MNKICSIPLCKVLHQNNITLNYKSKILLYSCFTCIVIHRFMFFVKRFPADEKLGNIWVERIKSYYLNFKTNNSSLVCTQHFEETDFIKTTRS